MGTGSQDVRTVKKGDVVTRKTIDEVMEWKMEKEVSLRMEGRKEVERSGGEESK